MDINERMAWMDAMWKGKEEGENKHATDTVIRMIRRNKFSYEDIAYYSGLPLEKVKDIAQNETLALASI